MADLTTLQRVKRYLRIDADDKSSDAELSDLISDNSRWFEQQTQRKIAAQRYTETRSGLHTRTIDLDQYPVTFVHSVQVDGLVIAKLPAPVQAATVTAPGWVLQDNRLELVDYTGGFEPLAGTYGPYFIGTSGPRLVFSRGFNNISITYTGGFAMLDEAFTVPSSLRVQGARHYVSDLGVSYSTGATAIAQTMAQQAVPGTPYAIQAPAGFITDMGVAYASGLSLTAVPLNTTGHPVKGEYTFTADGLYTFSSADAAAQVLVSWFGYPGALAKVTSSPTVGQYSVDADGIYSFAAADVGTSVTISYSTVPRDIMRAVTEKCAWDFKAGDRIGQRSKAIGGETITFMVDAVPASAQAVIDNYLRTPLP